MADAGVDPGFAPAKVNLTLHLEGRRSDGYHRLRSLVVFAGIGDRVAVAPGTGLSLEIGGPFAAGLDGTDNLVMRAARALAGYHGIPANARLRLEKVLPVASGLGGGSSDAAATLRVLAKHRRVAVPDGLALGLGADVPVCLAAPAPCVMSGIGDVLDRSPDLPESWLVLANPGVEVPTGAVFSGVADRHPPPGPALPAGGFADFDDLCAWLARQRNDLEASARAICPAIGEVLTALSSAPLARMSGSGATCFALCPDRATAEALAEHLRRNSDWWVAAAPVCRI